MASLTDILTASQNVVRAISNLGTTFLQVQGDKVSNNISAVRQVSSGQGRLVRVSVIDAGSAAGFAYDASSVNDLSAPIMSIPKAVGIIDVNIPTNNGIVIKPGTGQVITVSYS
jgi:hypothetical protein